tara:strand:- start:5668 stop:8916 length:3249 start_codon:yes stop_codon:yes gene_type:complete
MGFAVMFVACVFCICVSFLIYRIFRNRHTELFNTANGEEPDTELFDTANGEDTDTYKNCHELRIQYDGNPDLIYSDLSVGNDKYCGVCETGQKLKYTNDSSVECQDTIDCPFIPRQLCYYTSKNSEGFDYFSYSNETDEFSPCKWFNSKEIVTDETGITSEYTYELSTRRAISGETCTSYCPVDPETGEPRARVRNDNTGGDPTYLCVPDHRSNLIQAAYSLESSVEPSEGESSGGQSANSVSMFGNEEFPTIEIQFAACPPDSVRPQEPSPVTMWRLFWDRLVPVHEFKLNRIDKTSWQECSNSVDVEKGYNGFIFHPSEKICQHISTTSKSHFVTVTGGGITTETLGVGSKWLNTNNSYKYTTVPPEFDGAIKTKHNQGSTYKNVSVQFHKRTEVLAWQNNWDGLLSQSVENDLIGLGFEATEYYIKMNFHGEFKTYSKECEPEDTLTFDTLNTHTHPGSFVFLAFRELPYVPSEDANLEVDPVPTLMRVHGAVNDNENREQMYEDTENTMHTIRGMYFSYNHTKDIIDECSHKYTSNTEYIGNKKRLERWFEPTSEPSFEDYLSSNEVYKIISNLEPQRLNPQTPASYIIDHSAKKVYKHVLETNIADEAKTWEQCRERASNVGSNSFYFANDTCTLQHVFGTDYVENDTVDRNVTTGLNWDETYTNSLSNWNGWTLGVGQRELNDTSPLNGYINDIYDNQAINNILTRENEIDKLSATSKPPDWESCSSFCKDEYQPFFEKVQNALATNKANEIFIDELYDPGITVSNSFFQYNVKSRDCTCLSDDAELQDVDYNHFKQQGDDASFLYAPPDNNVYVIGFTGERQTPLTERNRFYMGCLNDEYFNMGDIYTGNGKNRKLHKKVHKCDSDFYRNEILKDNSKWYGSIFEPHYLNDHEIKVTIVDYPDYNHWSMCAIKLLDGDGNAIQYTLYTFGHISNPDSSGNTRYPNEIYPRSKPGERLGTWQSYSGQHNKETMREYNDYIPNSGFVLVPVDDTVIVAKLIIRGVRVQRTPSIKVEYKDKETDIIKANVPETSDQTHWLAHRHPVITVTFDVDDGVDNYPVTVVQQYEKKCDWCQCD